MFGSALFGFFFWQSPNPGSRAEATKTFHWWGPGCEAYLHKRDRSDQSLEQFKTRLKTNLFTAVHHWFSETAWLLTQQHLLYFLSCFMAMLNLSFTFLLPFANLFFTSLYTATCIAWLNIYIPYNTLSFIITQRAKSQTTHDVYFIVCFKKGNKFQK